MKYLITYGSKNYQNAKNRLSNEAYKTQQFDQIKAYGTEDLPSEITNNPLFQNERGGGYWIWKPHIIYDMLSQIKENDILVYVDAGCSLYSTSQWNKYFSIMQKYDLLTFRINCINEQYIKKEVIDYFTPKNGAKWKHYYQIAGTVLFLKKSAFTLNMIKEWKSLACSNLVKDVSDNALKFESKCFKDHRHDQAILTGLVYQYTPTHKIKILWNDFEALRKGQAIRATRISDKGIRSSKTRHPFKQITRTILINPLRSSYQLYWEVINRHLK